MTRRITSIPDLLGASARRDPGRMALACGGSGVTFEEWDGKTNQLARFLASRGLGPGKAAAVAVERGIGAALAILAVLKTGARYVPVDPAYPAAHLARVMEESRPALVLDDEFLMGALAESAGGDRSGLDLAIGSDWPAYTIYTSGSAGKPKGVTISHGNIRHYVGALAETLGIGAADRYLHTAPFSFSSSARQLFLPMSVGAAIEIAGRETIRDPRGLLQLVRDEGVTIVDLAPAYWRTLTESALGMEEGRRRDLLGNRLRSILAASERLHADLPRRWREDLGHPARIFNMYGQTETAGIVTVYPVPEGLNEGAGVPVGWPIPGVSIRLDEGEIVVSGPTVGLGYEHEAELTASRFGTEPDSGERYYRTGDRGRLRDDGALEYGGRIDQQVKIRGFRVEPGQVEAVLLKHAAVTAAAVTGSANGRGEWELTAFVVGGEAGLREFAKAELPDYMVPARFLRLERIPVNPNGKTDVRKLAEMAAASVEMEEKSGASAPLVRIWREVLGAGRVDADSNLFDLGGHSLSLMRIAARVEEEFRVRLPVGKLFQTPTLSGIAALIAAEAPGHPLASLAEALGEPAGEAVSAAERSFWLLEQRSPGGAVYSVPVVVELTGEVDYAALEAAVAGVVARQPGLRTIFPAPGGEPIRRVLSAAEFAFRLPVTDVDEAGMEIRKNELLRRGFDLEKGPLFRAEVLRSGGRALLAMTMHHIVSDDWSVGLLLRETAAIYEKGRLAGLEPPAPAAEPSEAGLAYWKDRLRGPLPLLELPCGRTRGTEASGRGAKLFFELGAELSGRLRALGRELGATLFMTLLAGFQALLSRYSGQTDLVIGSPAANRTGARREAWIGAFVNTLVLRTDLSGDPEFAEVVERTRRVAVEAFDHQDVPFARVVEELGVDRDPSRHPVFQTMFAFQNAPRGFSKLGAAAARVLEVDNGTSKFDLSLTFAEDGVCLRGEFEYSTDLFERGTVERMRGHLETLLGAVAANPRLRLCEAPLLTEGERRELDGWRGSAADYPRQACLHQLFEAQAERTPDAEAVVFEHSRLRYCDLNRRANRLARYLRTQGVGRESLVAVSMDRSLNSIAALLGVLKAGAAYVPVDPAYPPERRRMILEDSGAVTEVTAETFCQIDNMDETNPAFGCGPEDLAYVIYTSGSTGTPKGVMVTHRSVVNHAWWFREHYGVTAADRVLQFASVSFDAAAEEIYPFLLSGAAVAPRTDGALASARGLADLVEERGITVLDLPTAFWQDWTAELARAGIGLAPSLRLLVVGGEKVSRESLELWRTIAPEVRWSNTYGPTEATITASYFDFGPMDGAASVPIGRPIPNAPMYVLDERGNRVPVGIPGELYIGGDALARGYLRRPELTAERFVADPFSPQAGARMYKTGDLVRYRADGNLEFLERTDDQVKLRGFRIELGEIQAAIEKHPAVSQAVVLARGEGSDKTIAAYVVRLGEPACSGQELKDYLKDRLPGFMVPGDVVILDRLPLNGNGKVDRRALPDPASDGAEETDRRYVAPRNRTEGEVAAIWAKVLKRDGIGIHDSFFDLGGQSLKATQVMARIRDRFGKLMPLGALFHAPTVAQLAEILDRGEWELPVSSVNAIRSGGGRPLFCVHPDPVHAFRFNLLASHLGPGRPLYGIQPVSLEGGRIRTIEEIAAVSIGEMRMVQPRGPYALAGYCFGGFVAYEMAVQLAEAGEVVDLVALIDSACPAYARKIRAIDRAVLPIRRLGYHLQLMKSKGPESVTSYLEDRFRSFRAKAWRSVWNLAVALRAEESDSLPAFLQDATEAFIYTGESYHPRRYAGRIAVFRAAIQAPDSCDDAALGWGGFVDSVESVDVPGGHDYLLTEPAVRTIAARLRELLAGQESSPVYAEV